MKLLLTISLILISLLGFGQRTGDQYIVTYSTNTHYNYVITPPSYAANPTKSYPVVIQFNGLGETQNNWSTINAYGATAEITSGRWNGVQQFGDSTFEFIAISTQYSGSGTISADRMKRNIDSLKKYYRFDTTRIYVTGLSAGGQTFIRSAGWTASGNPDYTQWTAAFLMSSGSAVSGALVDSLAQWSRLGGSMMYTIASSDVGSNRIDEPTMRAAMLAGRSGSYYGYTWTSPPWPGDGHGYWGYGYDSSYKDPDLGLNAWEWLLGHTKRPFANAGQATITTSASSVTLNGITTQYNWGYNGWGSRTKTWTKKSGGSATITSPNSDTTTVTGLTTGTYVFTLTSANASGGLSASKDVTVNVVANNQGAMFIKKRGRKLVIKSAP